MAAARLGARPVAPSWALHGAVEHEDHANPRPDVILPDGVPAWIDGGPRGPVDGWPTAFTLLHRENVSVGSLAADRLTPAGEELSEEQRRAVEHHAGPIRVIAPAGSGKTRVLAARLRHLVLDRGVDPRLVTALAYNTRAAEELAGRVRDVQVDGRRPHVRTVHSLGLAICSAAMTSRPRVLTPDEVRRSLRRILAQIVPGGIDDVERYVTALTQVRLALRDPETIERERGDVPGLSELVSSYRTVLRDAQALDFDEQVHRATVVLLGRPDLRARFGLQATHLLVDEAQDLTPVFVLLVRLLAGPAEQVFAVGDDDQTIYGYAGASPRVLVDFATTFADAASATLTVNHRCPAEVVAAATRLLAHNVVRVEKSVTADPARSDRDETLRVVDVHAKGTLHVLVEEVTAALDTYRAEEIIVLSRVGATLLAAQVALAARQIPLEHLLGPAVLQRTGFRAALAYLRIATAPDRIAPDDVKVTLRHPLRRLTGIVPLQSTPMSLGGIARLLPSIDGEHRVALHRYVHDLDLLAAAARRGAETAALLTLVRDRVGLGRSLDALDGQERPEGSSHADDLDALIELSLIAADPVTFPAWLEGSLSTLATPEARPMDAPRLAGSSSRPRGLTLSTIHRVKGREWPVVILAGLRAGLIPHRRCEDIEEERRVLHVALTRAQRHAIVLVDSARPSPFLPELVGTLRPAHAPDDETQAVLLARLRDWRRQVATSDRVPAFLVAHDRTLLELSRRRPQDTAALAACHGIGPRRLARFGPELLALVAARAHSSSGDVRPSESGSRRLRRAPRIAPRGNGAKHDGRRDDGAAT